jgi:hydrogen peroxide-dependent heme synthase
MSGSELIRYAMWSVFRVADRAALDGAAGRPPPGWEASAGSAVQEALVAQLTELSDQAAGKGTVTRGCYDIQGRRAGADYMFWWLAQAPDDLQEIYVRSRRTRLGRVSESVWSAMALHGPAEFSQDHVPAFLAGDKPRAYLAGAGWQVHGPQSPVPAVPAGRCYRNEGRKHGHGQRGLSARDP